MFLPHYNEFTFSGANASDLTNATTREKTVQLDKEPFVDDSSSIIGRS